MIEVPAPTAVTTPVLLTTVATEVVLLLHVPPVVVSVSVVLDPIHSPVVPPMAAGPAVTVKLWIIRQVPIE